MCSQDQTSLQALVDETGELKRRMAQALPSYIELLRSMGQLPEELSRRYWASCVQDLLLDMEPKYRELEGRARQADLQIGVFGLGMAAMSRLMGMQPPARPEQFRAGISLSPSGEVEPGLSNDPGRPRDAIFLDYNQFVGIAQSRVYSCARAFVKIPAVAVTWGTASLSGTIPEHPLNARRG